MAVYTDSEAQQMLYGALTARMCRSGPREFVMCKRGVYRFPLRDGFVLALTRDREAYIHGNGEFFQLHDGARYVGYGWSARLAYDVANVLHGLGVEGIRGVTSPRPPSPAAMALLRMVSR